MSTRPASEASKVERRPLRVLLAEDDPDFRALLTTVLVRAGHEVITVADGKELLEYVASVHLIGRRADHPDVIVSDIRMPGVSGLDIAAGLRRARWGSPILLMTAFADERARGEAERWGARILDKPFELDTLCEVLQRLSATAHPSR